MARMIHKSLCVKLGARLVAEKYVKKNKIKFEGFL